MRKRSDWTMALRRQWVSPVQAKLSLDWRAPSSATEFVRTRLEAAIHEAALSPRRWLLSGTLAIFRISDRSPPTWARRSYSPRVVTFPHACTAHIRPEPGSGSYSPRQDLAVIASVPYSCKMPISATHYCALLPLAKAMRLTSGETCGIPWANGRLQIRGYRLVVQGEA